MSTRKIAVIGVAAAEEQNMLSASEKLRKKEDEAKANTQIDLLEKLAPHPHGLKQFLMGSILDSAEEMRIGGVGIDDWHSAGWGVPIILFQNSLFVIAWLYFVIVLTNSGMSVQYLSLQGSDTEQICVEIPRQVNLVVQGDVYGKWSTDASYRINSSAFQLEFTGSNITTQDYIATMERFRTKLKALSSKSRDRDAGWNAMMWSTFQFTDLKSQMQFYSTADASIIYDSDVTGGILTTAQDGLCDNAKQWGNFDSQSSKITYYAQSPMVDDSIINGLAMVNLTKHGPISFADFVNYTWSGYDACHKQYPAYAWKSWMTSPYTNRLELPFDIHTAVHVISLNSGIMDFDGLYATDSVYGTSASGGIPGKWWVNPHYLPMEPLFCVDLQAVSDQKIMKVTLAQIKGPPVCFVVDQTLSTPIFYYPITISMYLSNNAGFPVHCDCPRDKDNPGCNNRNYLFGFFYDLDRSDLTKSITFALKIQKFLVDDPYNGDKHAQDYLYPLLASGWTISPPSGPFYANQPNVFNASFMSPVRPNIVGSFREYHMAQWALICPWSTCGLLVFSFQKDQTSTPFLPLNQFGFQARNSPSNNATYGTPPNVMKREMCTNTIFNEAMFDSYILDAPSPLVQPYFECTKRTFSAFQEAAGNAAGIAGGLSSMAILVFGYLFRKIQNWRASRQKITDRTDEAVLAAIDQQQKLPPHVRIGDPRFQIGNESGENVVKLKPALVTNRQKERLAEKLADVRNESLLTIIESLVANCQQNRALIRQLINNKGSESGTSIDQSIQSDHDLDMGLLKLREMFEFDIDEAQLLQAMKRRGNHE